MMTTVGAGNIARNEGKMNGNESRKEGEDLSGKFGGGKEEREDKKKKKQKKDGKRSRE